MLLGAVTGISPGHTILVDSEQMYVREVVGNTLTVTRGVNGTTPSAHRFGGDVSVFAYPGPVTEAAILQVARLWRKDSLDRDLGGLHPDARHLLTSYRRPPTAAPG